MFRKTIAVLLMLSIVLSSCGKKDKDKSNDFLRTAPVESPVPAEDLVKVLQIETEKEIFEPYSLKCLVALRNCPTRDCHEISKVCSKKMLNSPDVVGAVISPPPGFCSVEQMKCFESLQKASGKTADCEPVDMHCIFSLMGGNSTSLSACSYPQSKCFAVYGFPFNKNPPANPINSTCRKESIVVLYAPIIRGFGFSKEQQKDCEQYLSRDYRHVALIKLWLKRFRDICDNVERYLKWLNAFLSASVTIVFGSIFTGQNGFGWPGYLASALSGITSFWVFTEFEKFLKNYFIKQQNEDVKFNV
jgi:hypothetical protein